MHNNTCSILLTFMNSIQSLVFKEDNPGVLYV